MNDTPVKQPLPEMGRHLASLNLFREPDGSLHITVADGRGAIQELDKLGQQTAKPIDYVNTLVRDAVLRTMALETVNYDEAHKAKTINIELAVQEHLDRGERPAAVDVDGRVVFTYEALQRASMNLRTDDLVREAVVNLEQRTIGLYQEALDHLVDMINGDAASIGRPWSDAEAFIKANAPEHYAKIGVHNEG